MPAIVAVPPSRSITELLRGRPTAHRPVMLRCLASEINRLQMQRVWIGSEWQFQMVGWAEGVVTGCCGCSLTPMGTLLGCVMVLPKVQFKGVGPAPAVLKSVRTEPGLRGPSRNLPGEHALFGACVFISDTGLRPMQKRRSGFAVLLYKVFDELTHEPATAAERPPPPVPMLTAT